MDPCSISGSYGYVEFNTTEEAKEQFQKSDMEIRGRKIFIDYASGKKQSELFVLLWTQHFLNPLSITILLQ